MGAMYDNRFELPFSREENRPDHYRQASKSAFHDGVLAAIAATGLVSAALAFHTVDRPGPAVVGGVFAGLTAIYSVKEFAQSYSLGRKSEAAHIDESQT